VKPKHRLDAIVKLREREEDRARSALADAQRKTVVAAETLRVAAARARQDERRFGLANDWELAELAQIGALREARQAELAAESAAKHLTRKLADFVGVHSRTEALRRVVKSRADEQLREAEVRDGKVLDEIAIFRHGYARSPR
jgi:flagellar biosynthesis chaperone FliJ